MENSVGLNVTIPLRRTTLLRCAFSSLSHVWLRATLDPPRVSGLACVRRVGRLCVAFPPLVSARVDVRPSLPPRSPPFAFETLRVRRCGSAARRASSPTNRSASAVPHLWRENHTCLETVNHELNSIDRGGERQLEGNSSPKDAPSRSPGRLDRDLGKIAMDRSRSSGWEGS